MKKILFLILLITLLIYRIEAQSTTQGYIITTENDTIEASFTVAKKKRIDRKNNFQFVEILKNDSLIRKRSTDILGFKKGELIYRSFNIASRDTSFFAKQVTIGKVALYYSKMYDGRYYFKKNREKEYYELDSQSESVALSSAEVSGVYIDYQTVMNAQFPAIKSNDDAFRDFFVKYFKDNQPIVNKLKQGFHSYSTIEAMFIEYNR